MMCDHLFPDPASGRLQASIAISANGLLLARCPRKRLSESMEESSRLHGSSRPPFTSVIRQDDKLKDQSRRLGAKNTKVNTIAARKSFSKNHARDCHDYGNDG